MSTSILLVDDHQIFRQGLCLLLEKQPGLRVVGEASNGKQAIEQTGLLDPDVVVVDIGLPDISGIEVARQMRKRFPRTRVVALSTHIDRSYVLAAIEAGIQGYVVKVGAMDELVAAIEAAMAGNSYFSHTLKKIHAPGNHTLRQIRSDGRALTPREREVLRLLTSGIESKGIAQMLKICLKTVDAHRRNIIQKVGTSNVAQLTKYALRIGLITLES